MEIHDKFIQFFDHDHLITGMVINTLLSTIKKCLFRATNLNGNAAVWFETLTCDLTNC